MPTTDQIICLARLFDLKPGEKLIKNLYASLKKVAEKQTESNVTGSFKLGERGDENVLDHIVEFIDCIYSLLFIQANHANAYVLIPEGVKKNIYVESFKNYSLFVQYFLNDDEIQVPSYFVKEFNEGLSQDKYDFIIFPIFFITPDAVHYNMCIYDKTHKSFERFEPYGALSVGEFDLDSLIQMFFNEELPNVIETYNAPIDFCPIFGFQKLQVIENEPIDADPHGFCLAWSVWYVDLRLFNPNKTQKQIIEFALKTLKTRGVSLTKFIRAYNNAFATFVHDYIEKNITLEMIKLYGDVIIYTLEGCDACIKAKKLLKKYRISFREYIVVDDIEKAQKRKKGQYESLSNLQSMFKKQLTFPIIFIHEKMLLGGFSDLQKLKER